MYVCVSHVLFLKFCSYYFFISCLFSKERQKRGTELDGGEDLEGSEGRGDCDLNILYEKAFIFSKKITFLNMIKNKNHQIKPVQRHT